MMKELKALAERHGATTRPATMGVVRALEGRLGIRLSPEYTDFLTTFGVIVHGASETYGLGVPDDYYLNVATSYADLSRDPTYPSTAVPLLDMGDGRYYLYDNATRKIVLWATPNGGIVRELDESLETFLGQEIFRGE
jgi:hypothetical protein